MSYPGDSEEFGKDLGEFFNQMSHPKLYFALLVGISILNCVITYYVLAKH